MIEARGLTKRFGSRLAVDALSFDVRPGRVTGFLGPNGSSGRRCGCAARTRAPVCSCSPSTSGPEHSGLPAGNGPVMVRAECSLCRKT